MPDKREQLVTALKHLVTAPSQDSTKGKYVTAWFKEHFGVDARCSYVTEAKQAYNRPDEQLKHKPDYVIFVTEDEESEKILESGIQKHARPNLKAAWILKKTAGQNFEGKIHVGESTSEVAKFIHSCFAGFRSGATSPVPPALAAVTTSSSTTIGLPSQLIESFIKDANRCGLQVPFPLAHRFIASGLAKRFLILTGLAGSGKTKLGQAFARWMTKDVGWIDPADHSKGKQPNPCFALVPVGADWTGNDNILGYPNGLDSTNYITRPTLDLMLHAQAHPDLPHFLILDEMNLSHVERYFADLLSLIESKEFLTLYCDKMGADGKPENTRGLDPVLKLPQNLFIIGTVNVDETTYMFSPKVLDRANVIEFRVSPGEMKAFLDSPVSPKLEELDGKGFVAGFAAPFVAAADDEVPTLPSPVKERYEAEMNLFFEVLRAHGAEFGYRVAHEAARFFHYYQTLSAGKVWDPEADAGEGRKGRWADKDGAHRDWFDHAFDAIVIQKFLPKLHGSKVKLGPLLKKLHTLSIQPPAREARAAKSALEKQVEPAREIPGEARYPLTAEKVSRMWRQLNENGFTSFPEN